MSMLILGTAGHIDHGKTALVRALTGVDTDRLPEEKQRGITIDLGFASLRLGDLQFGVVDVPGHEGFIRNMLAGATGMDAVLLVVAADEGVMPQTREHIAILDLLGVSAGVVAITKSDLVDPEWCQLVGEDVRDTVRATCLAGAPIVPVSARTGLGLDALRAAIIEQTAGSPGRLADDVFRMPIDRVFTVRGTGTVVTGTIWSGAVRTGEQVRIGPGDMSARVRGIEIHGTAIESARAGDRAALALSGIEKAALDRGHAVTATAWPATRMLVADIRVIPGTDWTLQSRQRVRTHVGTMDVLARVVLLDADELAPGDSGSVQLRLEQPIIARAGDRVVLRSYSPVTTIGGGVVLELGGRKRSRILPQDVAALNQVISADPVQSVAAALRQSGESGATVEDLAIRTPHGPGAVESGLAATGAVRIRDLYFARQVFETSVHRIIDKVDELHREEPLKPWFEYAEVRSAFRGDDNGLLTVALDTAIEGGDLCARGTGVTRPGFQPTLTPRHAALRSSILATLASAGLAAPELAALGPPDQVRPLLRLLELDGLVRPVAQDLYLETGVLEAAAARTRRELGGRSGLSAAEFRATLPVSRKHLIPLLEYFDRTGVTEREGDLRRVAETSEAG